MSLPTTFANLTDATGAQLDANYAALGALTPIPCTVTGTSALTLTPAANTPTQTGYANYKQFTFVNANTNAGSATLRVGSFAALNIYKDTPAGPALLSGSELVANCAATVMYDSALNSGAGGWHLVNAIGNVTFAGGTFTGPITGTTISATLLSATNVTASATVSGAQINATAGASIAALQIAGGASMVRSLSTTSGITLSALLPNTGTTAAIVLPGCSIGDIVSIGYPVGVTAAMIWKGVIDTPGTVTLQAFNASTVSTITPVAGTYRVAALGFN